jgi:hypothetical protein
MPIDERWDQLTDADWSKFARIWVEQLRSGVHEGERDYGDTVVMMNFTARPEQQWKFLLAAVAHTQTDDELGHIAARPMEHLLGWHGDQFIDDFELHAATNPKFARAMTGMYQYKMSDAIWVRVRAIQERAEPLKYSADS